MPFDASKPQTLANVRAILEDSPGLAATRKRDRISAIVRVATMSARAPADLPCDAPGLRAHLETIHPAQHGITARSLANVKSALSDALTAVGAIPQWQLTVARSEAWIAFLDHADVDHQGWSLSRFTNFCCNSCTDPADVDDETMAKFHEYLDARLLTKDPAKLCKQMCQTWNGIVRRNCLSLAILDYERGRQYQCRPLTDYPESLQDEMRLLLDRLSQSDLFDPDAPDKGLRPTSLRNTEAHLRQYLDALVHSGVDPLECRSLKGVVTAEHMKHALKAMLERLGGDRPTWGMNNTAGTLLAIARHHLKLPPEELQAIIAVRKRVSREPRGMSSKNAKRLSQFNDWDNIVRLIALPADLMERARQAPISSRSALLAMHAASMSVLLSCPMRAKNLAGLDIERHLLTKRNGTHAIYTIRIEGHEVKNEEPIEVRLNARNSRMLHTYITKFRPVISDVRGTALFPRRSDGGPRSPGQLSQSLSDLIWRETGLKVHTHLFRHFAAKLYLSENPGDFETVRRLLRHKNLRTTLEFYAEISNQWAHDRYDEVVLARWGGDYNDN
ncbi:tyrosine-type recombinase/integrase [Tateyamaria sp.]|uniref:tyrosine-type recombinase/integrase n=1 Tax=Tateyamaria sp. TaxID=1929288 RepID=UPI0032A066DE